MIRRANLVGPISRVCKAVLKAKGGYLKNLKYKIYTLFWLLHDSMCYFIVFMSPLLIYNVENSAK